MDTLIGQHLGQYEIISKIGTGGMATVYRARQTSIDRDVAIKVLRADLIEDVDFAERFQREARTIASLSHLHILKVFDYGHQGGLAYLVMELLEGGSLSRLIHQGGPLPIARANRLLDQIAQALDYAHQRGIIHRDLKPDNVLLDKSGNAFLTDFGIAKLLNETTSLTRTGTMMGTPAYMAPELWSGQPADARADIYALGVILYEMLTGKSPFLGDTPFRIMHMHIYEPVAPVRNFNADLPEGTDSVLGKALAKDREARYASAGQLAEAFRVMVETQGPSGRPAGSATASAPAMPPNLPESRTPARATMPGAAMKAPTLPDARAPRRRSGLLAFGIVGLLILLGVSGLVILPRLTGSGLEQTPGPSSEQLTATQQAALALLPSMTLTFTPLPPSATASPPPSDTATNTTMPTATATLTLTLTPTPSPTLTLTNTFTPTSSPTITATFTSTVDPQIVYATLVEATLAPLQTATAVAQSIAQTVNAVVAAEKATAAVYQTESAQKTQIVFATIEMAQTLARATLDVQATRNAFDAQATRIAFNAQTTGTAASAMTATMESLLFGPTITLVPSSTPTAVTCPGFMPSRLIAGEYGRVTPGDPNRLRQSPGTTGKVIDQMPGGSVFKVLDGPVCTPGIAWWHVEWKRPADSRVFSGWTAEGQGNVYWTEPLGPGPYN
jgi:serine/threonine protein kinase